MKHSKVGLIVGVVLAASVVVWAQPSINFLNQRISTDANSYLLVSSGQYTAPASPARSVANTPVKTDANGYLLVAFPGGLSNIAAGTGTQTGSPVLSIFTSTTAASNVSTGETDLITYSLPANTLSANNQKLRITTWGTLANTANTKTVKVYVGATVVASLSGATANTTFYAQATAIRTGATAQISYGAVDFGSLALFNRMTASPAETLSGAVTIKVTGQSSAASSDVTALAMLVEWVP